jgi:hypothetical protein
MVRTGLCRSDVVQLEWTGYRPCVIGRVADNGWSVGFRRLTMEMSKCQDEGCQVISTPWRRCSGGRQRSSSSATGLVRRLLYRAPGARISRRMSLRTGEGRPSASVRAGGPCPRSLPPDDPWRPRLSRAPAGQPGCWSSLSARNGVLGRCSQPRRLLQNPWA